MFDICHACRRCVSLCQSFPTLFDLIDATVDGEVHGVANADYAKVVDQCHLCDLNGPRSPGKVATFSTCDVNCDEPGIGFDLVKLLEHNEFAYTVVEKESCCGMPKLELGDLDSVAKHEEANIPVQTGMRKFDEHAHIDR